MCKAWLEKNSKDMTIGVLSLRMRHEVAGEYKKKDETEGEKRWRENIKEAERMLGTEGLSILEKQRFCISRPLPWIETFLSI